MQPGLKCQQLLLLVADYLLRSWAAAERGRLQRGLHDQVAEALACIHREQAHVTMDRHVLRQMAANLAEEVCLCLNLL